MLLRMYGMKVELHLMRSLLRNAAVFRLFHIHKTVFHFFFYGPSKERQKRKRNAPPKNNNGWGFVVILLLSSFFSIALSKFYRASRALKIWKKVCKLFFRALSTFQRNGLCNSEFIHVRFKECGREEKIKWCIVIVFCCLSAEIHFCPLINWTRKKNLDGSKWI